MGYMYDHVTIMRIFTIIMNKVFICASKTLGKWLQPRFRFAHRLVLIACFISNEKWANQSKTIILFYGHFTHVTKVRENK
jgi:hypothetical protein